MAFERVLDEPFPWQMTVWLPNERGGQILGGTETHIDVTRQACLTVEAFGRDQHRDWLVRQETQLIYPRLGGPPGSLYPDCLVAAGVTIAPSEPYDLQAVGRPPALVIEIVSRHTQGKDKGTDKKIQGYAELGIQEYLYFDPRPRKGLELRGYRLLGRGHYQQLAPAPEGGLWLQTIGLRVTAELPDPAGRWGRRLRFWTANGEPLPHTEEVAAARRRAERQHADERVARLRAERERRQAEESRRQAEEARHQAEEARRQAERDLEEEHAARMQAEERQSALEAELARLRAQLAGETERS